jgi:hypothetical protein
VENARHDKLTKERNLLGAQEGTPKKKNSDCWFLQNTDGTLIASPAITSLCGEAKYIWSNMSKSHGPLGLPWTTVSQELHLEFCVQLERMYPCLHLCADHYKVNVVTTSDYTHWYKDCYHNPCKHC